MSFDTWVIAGEKLIRSEVLKVWSPDQEHQRHLGKLVRNAHSQAPSKSAESEALGVGPSSLCLTSPPGDFPDVYA